jgi:hypothetical protein
LLFACVAAAAAQNVEQSEKIDPFVMPSARAFATGGHHAAFSDDFNVFFSNPALLATIEPEFSLAEFSLEFIDFGVAGLLFNHVTNTPSESSVLYAKNSKESGLHAGGPLALGVIRKNWGIGAFNITRFHLAWTSDDKQLANITSTEEFLITGGYGRTLFNKGGVSADAGLSLKAFFRAGFLQAIWYPDLKYFLERTNNATIETQLGGGVDAGVRLRIGPAALGLVMRDAYTAVYKSNFINMEAFNAGEELFGGMVSIMPRLAFGLLVSPEPPFWKHIISGFRITLDFHQMLFFLEQDYRSPLLELGVGFEVTLNNTFSFRMGLYEMLPTAGFGLRLGLFQFDITAGLREFGQNIWEYPTLTVLVGVLYRYKK